MAADTGTLLELNAFQERLDLEDLLKQLLKREDEVSLALAIYEALSEGDTSRAIAIINEFIGANFLYN